MATVEETKKKVKKEIESLKDEIDRHTESNGYAHCDSLVGKRIRVGYYTGYLDALNRFLTEQETK